ncbi:putative calcium-transporting ATPase 13, plasma membrane-type [Vitis vinifera]|uniref:Putative calcium-transporting ATPase 13, plasma membrane-type n=1 Tax=Vitis vinifera TaxID=29760 RepID=A0A438J4H3_VITVI|nr:putative calcium-transporting ATPase 13, plasma membrane-type [Vitis vinifera]
MLDDPTTVSKPSKRWRLASATTPSSVVLNVQPDAFSDIDKTSLNAMVREKNVDQLLEAGGVVGVAGALKTDIKMESVVLLTMLLSDRQLSVQNTYQRQPAKSLIHFAVEACKDLTNLVLLLCATLSLGFGIKEQGLKKGEQTVQRLSKVSNNIKVDVVRNGRSDQQTSIFDIVVGDVVCVKSGDQVPADGLFLNGHSLQVDESSMTGKGGCVEVNSDKNPFLLSGTKVADGYARMLVTSVGKVGLAVAFLVLVVLLVRYFTGNTEDENGNQEFIGSKTKVVDMVNSVGMMADQAMVRKLSACETMGSATTICTDKTGILTLNQMEVTKFWLGQDPVGVSSSISTNLLNLIHQGVALNTFGSVYRATSGSKFEFSGSPIEKAILSWAVRKLDMDMETTKLSCTILHVEPFNSEKKRSGVSMRSNADNTIHVHWKELRR